jgi:two-component system, NtrC family, response regulator AtoC
MPERVLIVEDEETLRENLERYLGREGYEVRAARSAEEVLDPEFPSNADVALVDIHLPGIDGLSLASELARRGVLVVVMTAYGSIDSAVEALDTGVHGYVVKPLRLREVAARVARMCEHRRVIKENARLRRLLAEPRGSSGIIGHSRALEKALALVRQIAPSSSTVLIQGESGSGKELLARALHDWSARRDGPFIAVNTTAIPDSLAESQLFGHERGAFTGADVPREGLFRAAHGGTLFLDEIGDLPLQQQAKLLRALETKEVVPVGGSRAIRVDCRIVAATNSELSELVREKRFRSDLYYRLSAIRVDVPPLRKRSEDIPALAHHFLETHAAEHRRPVVGIEADAMLRLLGYSWPGNVRELSNVIERAVVVCAGGFVGLADLPPELAGAASVTHGEYHGTMDAYERPLLGATLERAGGDRREAARLLGMPLATLYRRIDKLGLKDSGASRASGDHAVPRDRDAVTRE